LHGLSDLGKFGENIKLYRMKKWLFLTLMFGTIFTFALKSQQSVSFRKNFIGEDFLKYKGAIFKLDTSVIEPSLNYSFYSDFKYCYSALNSKVVYPCKDRYYTTCKDSLKNRQFLVKNIVTKYGVESKAGDIEDPIFVLEDNKTKQIIYYRYNRSHEYLFPFLTSEIYYNSDDYCDKVSVVKDDFTDKITISSPYYVSVENYPVVIFRFVKNGQSNYYLSLHSQGSTVNVDIRGVIVIFDDGTKWTNNSEIDVDATENGFDYKAFIKLTPSDLSLFSTKRISKYRLYIYDTSLNYHKSSVIKIFINCVIDRGI
jgi:hypothetical protein